MILIAVIVGYVLGCTPFILQKILTLKSNEIKELKQDEVTKTQEQILDEWLNGKKEETNIGINQEDILKEYLTGKESNKGG